MAKLGDCFEANEKWFIRLFKNDKGGAVLCHGDVIGDKGTPVEGKRFPHCWIEKNGYFLDFSNGRNICLLAAPLYEQGRIITDSVRRYTIQEVALLSLHCKHYGPYTDKDREILKLLVRA